MIEDEAARLIGLDCSGSAGTPTASLRENPDTRLSSLAAAAAPPPPMALGMSSDTIQALNDIFKDFSSVDFTPLKFNANGRYFKSKDSRKTSNKFTLGDEVGRKVDAALRSDPDFADLVRGTRLKLESTFVLDDGGPDGQVCVTNANKKNA